MNTREEIRQAMMDYQAGKFGGLRQDGGPSGRQRKEAS